MEPSPPQGGGNTRSTRKTHSQERILTEDLLKPGDAISAEQIQNVHHLDDRQGCGCEDQRLTTRHEALPLHLYGP